MVAAVASFAVMASVMNLAGYVAIGRGHHEGDVFTMISVHIVGMYGLVLVVGDLIDRFGRRRSMVTGLALMTVSNAALVWLGGVGGMSLALLGLGLGWSLSYVGGHDRARLPREPVGARRPDRLLRPRREPVRGGAGPPRRPRLHRRRSRLPGDLGRALAALPALWLAAKRPVAPVALSPAE